MNAIVISEDYIHNSPITKTLFDKKNVSFCWRQSPIYGSYNLRNIEITNLAQNRFKSVRPQQESSTMISYTKNCYIFNLKFP